MSEVKCSFCGLDHTPSEHGPTGSTRMNRGADERERLAARVLVAGYTESEFSDLDSSATRHPHLTDDERNAIAALLRSGSPREPARLTPEDIDWAVVNAEGEGVGQMPPRWMSEAVASYLNERLAERSAVDAVGTSPEGICAHPFDSTVCVADAGHEGPHTTSNERFPHGLSKMAWPSEEEMARALHDIFQMHHGLELEHRAIALGECQTCRAGARALLARLREGA